MSSYWDPTSSRIAYDRDGTVVTWWDQSYVINRASQPILNILNSESGTTSPDQQVDLTNIGSTYTGGYYYYDLRGLAFLFPFQRDMTAFFCFGLGNLRNGSTLQSFWRWQTSPDSTNGIDGTWYDIAPGLYPPFVKPYYRDPSWIVTPAVVSALLNVKAVRFHVDTTLVGSASVIMKAIHLYGDPSSGATHERVALWHPTSNIPLPGNWFNWGDIARSTTADKTFRVKNLSSTQTANSILLQTEVPSDTTPTVLSQFSIGDTTPTFATTQTIGSLAPGAISSVYTFRRTTSSTAALSVWTGRLDANVGSWT